MSDKDFPGSDDLSLPKATVQKIIAEILHQISPSASSSASKDKDSDLTFTRPARDLLITCSLEFLRMLSSEANEISEKESKKTISVEHVEAALKDLGFGGYIESCRGVVGEWQETQKKRTGRGERMRDFGGMKDLGEEELERIQQALFGESKAKLEGVAPGS